MPRTETSGKEVVSGPDVRQTASPTPFALRQAARLVRAGLVIAYPTEAVYGLGCDPMNELAVRRLLAIKRRSPDKGLIVVAARFEQLLALVEMPDPETMRRVRGTWPGPVTWLLAARDTTPRWLTGRHTTLAVRVTGHPVAAALCRVLDAPLVSTSANVSDRPPARRALEVRRRFGAAVDYVLPGRVGGEARPSEIRDARSGRVVRSSASGEAP